MAAKGHVSGDVYLVSGQTSSHITVEEYRLPAFLRILIIAIFTSRNILTHTTPSAPRRALLPGEHSFTVNLLFLPFLNKGGLICLLLRAFGKFPCAPSRVAWSILDCARRTSTLLSCAFREQEDGQAARFLIFWRACVVVVFFSVNGAQAFFLEQGCGVGNHGTVPAEVDSETLDRNDPLLYQPQDAAG